ncbi:unnamed protein product [Rhizoctonia solani]|uniref:Uncharacterized protein n=1 Tax=Rhizoctonia solani TaxID=456999 RepID=A0A8H3C9B6_9AGAM|nr:unnamed protein product [Rhizoctonia solani]CAE6478512.1 unnamed protein product [Rhizoctonia solani]
MVVFVISGASYGLGPELVRQASHDHQNTVFALVESAQAAKRLAGLSSVRSNIHIYFETQRDRHAGYEIIARDISRTVPYVDILLNIVSWVGDCLGTRNLSRPNQTNDLQQSFSNHVLDTIHITNAFIPLLHRGSLKKVVTISSDQAFNHHAGWPSGFDGGIAYAMGKKALDMTISRYSGVPELQQNRFVYAMIECEPVNTSEKKKGDCSEDIQRQVQEIFEMVERLGCDDSGRCVKLRECDLITF